MIVVVSRSSFGVLEREYSVIALAPEELTQASDESFLKHVPANPDKRESIRGQ